MKHQLPTVSFPTYFSLESTWNEICQNFSCFAGNEDGFNLRGSRTSNTMATDRGSVHTHPAGHAEPPFYQPGNNRPPIPIRDHPYNHSTPYPPNYSNYVAARPSYQPASGLTNTILYMRLS